MPFVGKVVIEGMVHGESADVSLLVVKSLLYDFMAGIDFITIFGLKIDALRRTVEFRSGRRVDVDFGRVTEPQGATVPPAARG
eukprot:m.464451 g.464451  ORF g.464451 m.464451 type:complete len:83 (-) comp57046_c0_seq19:1976-2224(-)